MSKTLNLINKTVAMKKAYTVNYFEPLPAARDNGPTSHANDPRAHEAEEAVRSFPWDQVLHGSFVLILMLIVLNLFFVTHKLVAILNAQKESFDLTMNDYNNKVEALNVQLASVSDHLQKSTDQLRDLSLDQKLLEMSTEEVRRLSGALLKEYSALDKKLEPHGQNP